MNKLCYIGCIFLIILLSFLAINTVQAETVNYETYLNLDYPTTNYINTDMLEINGWVLSTCSDRTIQILWDGEIQDIDITTRERPDVLNAIPGYGGADTNAEPGFKANLDLSDVIDGEHTLTIRILTKAGEILAEETRNLTTQKYQTYLNLDYPNTNYIDTNTLEINGWVLSTCSDRTIQILLDGKVQGVNIPTRERPDVLSAISGYGGVATNAKPGFKATLDLLNIPDGVHTLTIRILTKAGEILAEETRNLTIQKYQTYLNVDYPSTNQIDTDILEINGWVLSTCSNRTIQILFDGEKQNIEIPTRERPDVLNAIPGYGGAVTNSEPGFKTSLNLKNISDGEHNLTIRIIATNSGEILAEETRNLTIKKYQTYLNVDYPSTSQIDTDILEIDGWALSTCSDRTIQIIFDGEVQKIDIPTRERPDVLNAISGYGGAETNIEPGFKASLDLTNIEDGAHTLIIKILASNGETLAEETRILNIHKYPTYLNIDFPINYVGSTQLEINGWVMSNYKDKTIEIKVDGVAQEVVTRERPDVINAIEGYGGIERNPKPGFKVLMDVSDFEDGIHTMSVRILTKEGNILAEEIRNFTLVKYPTMIYIDTPSQGHITGRDTINLSGWIMSAYDDVTLKIYLNDVQIEEEITRRARPDVVNSVEGYGDITTNPTPGFGIELLLTSYPEGNYTFRVVAEKEDGTELSSTTVNFSINRTILRGIDISEHQGNIDWEKVKNEVDFVIIRCGYGVDDVTQDDRYFLQNIEACKRLGIPYGIYIYSYAVNTDKAISEAQHVRRLLTQAGDYTTPEFGIWFDMEGDSYKAQYNVSNETYRAIAHTFVSEMNKYGYDNIGIYANLNWWTTILNDTSLDKYPKWVAQYNSQCDYEKDYVMWQYTSGGTVNGISGNVDMNYYYCYR